MARYVEERTEEQKLQMRAVIAELYMRGQTQAKIAAQIGVHYSTVSRDLAVLRAQWLKDANRNFDQRKAEELQRIDEVEREAWEAWKRSIGEVKVTFTKRTSGENPKDEASIRTEHQAGDPRFLTVIQSCIDQRCRIFGFYAPTKIDIKDLDKLVEMEIDLIKSNAKPEAEDGATGIHIN